MRWWRRWPTRNAKTLPLQVGDFGAGRSGQLHLIEQALIYWFDGRVKELHPAFRLTMETPVPARIMLFALCFSRSSFGAVVFNVYAEQFNLELQNKGTGTIMLDQVTIFRRAQ